MNDFAIRIFEKIEEKFPRVRLGKLPTPIERLKNIEKKLGTANLWIKRDDLSHKTICGNKLRKLEYIIGSVLEKKRKNILSFGPAGSNWLFALNEISSQFDIKTHIYTFEQYTTNDYKYNKTQNIGKAYKSKVSESLLTYPFLVLSDFFKFLSKEYHVVGFGGSSNEGMLGYVVAVKELCEQLRENSHKIPEVIFLPLGTGGTIAGVALGFALLRLPVKIYAVRITRPIAANSKTLHFRIWMLKKFLKKKIGAKIDRISDFVQIKILKNYLGEDYAIPTPQAIKAKKFFFDEEGIELDTTYTSKTAAGFLDFVSQMKSEKKDVLFWHTYKSIIFSC